MAASFRSDEVRLNEWHGSAYYFGRNPLLNARRTPPPPLRRSSRHNVWGVTSGNPIIRNKVFNFFSYEARTCASPSTSSNPPTALEREGDFSRTMSVNAGLTALKPVYNPFTTQTTGSTVSRMPFAGNLVPKSMMDPTSLRFLKDVWAPNLPGDDATGVNNYRLTIARVYDYYNYTNRTDWNVSDKWKIFGRVSRFHTNVASPNPPGSPASSTGGSERNTLTIAGDAVWTVNPNTVLDFRGSYNKPVDRFIDAVAEIPNLRSSGPTIRAGSIVTPRLFRPLLPRLATRRQFGPRRFTGIPPRLLELASQDRQNLWRHYIKAGGECRRYRGIPPSGAAPVLLPRSQHRQYLRQSEPPSQRTSMGYISAGRYGRQLARPQRAGAAGPQPFLWFYFQDDFKISQNLTLNLGIRWVRHPARRSRRPPVTHARPRAPFPNSGRRRPCFPASVLAIRKNQPAYNGAWLHRRFPCRRLQRPEHLPATFRPLAPERPHRSVRLRPLRHPASVDIEGGINLNDVVPYGLWPGHSHSPPFRVFPVRGSRSVPQSNPLTQPAGKSLRPYTGSVRPSSRLSGTEPRHLLQ